MRNSSEKKLLTNECCFIFLKKKKTSAITLPDKSKQQLSANFYHKEARTYPLLTAERARMILLCDVVFKTGLLYHPFKYLRGMNTHSWEATHQNCFCLPSEKWSTLEGKISFFRVDPFSVGKQTAIKVLFFVKSVRKSTKCILSLILHYENMPFQIYWKFDFQKLWYFHMLKT